MQQTTDSFFGIIIRSFLPVKQKIVVLSKQHGIHHLICRMSSGCVHGGLIEWQEKRRSEQFFLVNYELVALPDRWAADDIVFLHSVFQLVHACIPVASNPEGMFEHLLLLYKSALHENREFYKKVFLCRFFSLLGLYPEYPQQYDEKFLCLISAPIDIMLSEQEMLLDKNVDAWVRGCVRTHSLKIKTGFL